MISPDKIKSITTQLENLLAEIKSLGSEDQAEEALEGEDDGEDVSMDDAPDMQDDMGADDKDAKKKMAAALLRKKFNA